MAGMVPARVASVVRMAAPVGVTSSRFTPVSTTGKPLSSSAVPGPGMGIRPCAPVTKPPPTGRAGQGRAVARLHAQQMKADARPGDIDDGVNRTYVMEVDLVHRGPVHAGFGL